MLMRSFAMVLCVTVVACGGDDDAPAADAAGGDTGVPADAGPPSRQPPPPGPTMAPDGTGAVTFAVNELFLGNTKRDGTPDMANGWKEYGFDLDHRTSTAASTDLCKPRDNASAANVYPDGAEGIDNSFGKNILPILLGISADYAVQVNDSLTSGKATTLLSLQQLGAGADYNPLVTRLYHGAAMPAVPKFDGTDLWPVDEASLTAPDLASPRVVFSGGYVVGNTWVSGPTGQATLYLDSSVFGLTVPLASAVITMDLNGAHDGAVNGTIAGVIATTALQAEFRRMAGTFDPSLCMGPTIDSILAQIGQASDIMVDGTQDPTKDCDGVSIGIGFTASIVQLGSITAATPPVDPCP